MNVSIKYCLPLIAIIIACSNVAYARMVKPTIGVGLLQVSLNHDIPLYRNAKADTPFDTIHFSRVDSGENKGMFLLKTNKSLNINPLSHYEGDSEEDARSHRATGLVYFAPTLVFTVVQLTPDGYEVIINEKTRKTVIIKNDNHHKIYTVGKSYWEMDHPSNASDEIWFLFETWETYLKRLRYIRIGEGQYLYDAINGQKIDNRNLDTGVVVEVAGHWAKIEKKTYVYQGPTTTEAAWVKWTDGKRIIVKTIASVYM